MAGQYLYSDGREEKKILNIVVVICVVIWLPYAFGVISHSGDIRVPQVR